jgi:hypothetical protein
MADNGQLRSRNMSLAMISVRETAIEVQFTQDQQARLSPVAVNRSAANSNPARPVWQETLPILQIQSRPLPLFSTPEINQFQ